MASVEQSDPKAPTYEPGTVAVATVRGVENVRIMRRAGGVWPWYAVSDIGGVDRFADEEITDVRHLVVLDPARDIAVHDLAGASELLRTSGDFNGTANFLFELAAAHKPGIPEPGLWGVVEADEYGGERRIRWVHTPSGWQDEHATFCKEWAELVDPTLVREGVA